MSVHPIFVLKRCTSASLSSFPVNSGLKCDLFNHGTGPGCAGSTASCVGGEGGAAGCAGDIGGGCGAGGSSLAFILYMLY